MYKRLCARILPFKEALKNMVFFFFFLGMAFEGRCWGGVGCWVLMDDNEKMSDWFVGKMTGRVGEWGVE